MVVDGASPATGRAATAPVFGPVPQCRQAGQSPSRAWHPTDDDLSSALLVVADLRQALTRVTELWEVGADLAACLRRFMAATVDEPTLEKAEEALSTWDRLGSGWGVTDRGPGEDRGSGSLSEA